jgi:flagellar hook-associated protein 2
VQDLQKQQTRLTDRLSSIETALRRQYTALDGNLSRMNTTSLYLTQQIAQIQANK